MKRIFVILFLVLTCHVLMAQAASIRMADSLYHAGRYSAALEMAEQLSHDAEQSGDITTCLKAWCIMGEAYFESGEEDKARDFCYRCYVKIAEGKDMLVHPDITLLSASLASTSRIYKINGEYDEAKKYILRSLSIDKALKRGGTVALRYGELTDILIAQGRYEEALVAIDSARLYIGPGDRRMAAMQYYDAGLCMEAMGDSLAAEKFFKDADSTAYRSGSDNVFGPVYLNKLASYALAHGDRDSALDYYMRVVNYNSRSIIDMSPHYEASKALAEMYEGVDEVLSAKYAAQADSLDFHPALRSFASKLALYNIDFPRREREQIIRNQRLNLWLVSSVLMLVSLILILLFFRYRDLQKISRLREEQNEFLRMANAQKDEILEISKSIADEHVREEVSRIASELGDVAKVKLTKRETEIAALIAQGLLNKEIATHLNISVRTVEFHRNAIYRKLGINNAVELMRYLKETK